MEDPTQKHHTATVKSTNLGIVRSLGSKNGALAAWICGNPKTYAAMAAASPRTTNNSGSLLRSKATMDRFRLKVKAQLTGGVGIGPANAPPPSLCTGFGSAPKVYGNGTTRRSPSYLSTGKPDSSNRKHKGGQSVYSASCIEQSELSRRTAAFYSIRVYFTFTICP